MNIGWEYNCVWMKMELVSYECAWQSNIVYTPQPPLNMFSTRTIFPIRFFDYLCYLLVSYQNHKFPEKNDFYGPKFRFVSPSLISCLLFSFEKYFHTLCMYINSHSGHQLLHNSLLFTWNKECTFSSKQLPSPTLQ